jgi:DnaJ-class molecular chaperone
MKIIKRIILVMCPACFGTGNSYHNGKKHVCEMCKGAGLVERVVNEVESVEDKE